MDSQSNLRKSLYSLENLPKKYFSQLIAENYFNVVVTEKTDGFAFEIGRDEKGLYVRSATSPKIRSEGQFFELSSKFFGTENYDPKIAARLEFALFLILGTKIKDVLFGLKMSIVGELFIKYNNIVYTPNHTQYNSQSFGTYGGFVIHTRHRANFSLTRKMIDDIKDCSNEAFIFDTDEAIDVPKTINLPAKILTVEEPEQRKLVENAIISSCGLYAKRAGRWGSGVEGYVVHLPDFSFKIMRDKLAWEPTQSFYNSIFSE